MSFQDIVLSSASSPPLGNDSPAVDPVVGAPDAVAFPGAGVAVAAGVTDHPLPGPLALAAQVLPGYGRLVTAAALLCEKVRYE